MDIISDYGSDVWGSNPYEPATLKKSIFRSKTVKMPLALFTFTLF